MPTPSGPPHPAVFFDRDDTLIACNSVVPSGDLGDPALVRLLPGAAEACSLLKAAGYRLIVVTNQGGVARGRFPTSAVHLVNRRLGELLEGAIDGFYFCPYHPMGTVPEFTREHPWRKPQPGMLLAAAADLSLSLPDSWLVGDSPRDIAAGKAAGCRTVLLGNAPPSEGPAPDFLAPDLLTAARLILDHGNRS